MECPSSNRRRGRPKKEDAEIVSWDIRLTPCDGEEVDFEKWFTDEDFVKVIAGRETGKVNQQLHYHIYLETKRSPTWIENLLYKASRWTPHHPRGNSVFSKKHAHEGTKGYVVKEEDLAYTIGFTDQELTALVEQSRQYRRDLEASKKSRVRKSQNTMKQFVEDAIEHFRGNMTDFHSPTQVVKFILEKYQESGMPFPSRSQMENSVMRVMYQFNPNYVNEYYSKYLV